VKENQLEAVISLPSGVFKPYAGVSTAILVFTKGGKTDHVFFYDVRGRRLLARRQARPGEGERPARRARALAEAEREEGHGPDGEALHGAGGTSRPRDFDLSINRYKEAKHEAVEYDPPKKIIAKLRASSKRRSRRT
jgi:type I restriction enzyme M protein